MNYRREIDGLRALAVLPVILFHADFETFSGGFVGVDVFFVISGFLITTIILDEMEKGKFSISKFYERRARRILPALFLVMLVCMPVAWFQLLPSDMKDFSQSILAVSLFSSNILFWRESGYFDTGAESKPLLHTWSLSVEEQFYVLLPLFLILFWRLGKHWILFILGFTFFASLAVAEWAAYEQPSAAFYLLPTRCWELLLGVFAAFYLSQPNHTSVGKSLSEFGGWLGIALIVYSVFAFNKATPFPSLYALVPTLGTVLVILFATQQTFVGKFIGNKAFVGLGLISYSAYLWHQPLFAFARHESLTEPSPFTFLVLSILALVLAYFTWKLVESPFRDRDRINRHILFKLSISGTIFFCLIGALGHIYGNQIAHYKFRSNPIIAHSYQLLRLSQQTSPVFIEANRHDNSDCRFSVVNLSPSVSDRMKNCYSKYGAGILIFGDSHATNLFHSIISNQYNNKYFFIIGVSKNGCHLPSNDGGCHYAEILEFLSENPVAFKSIIYEKAGHLMLDLGADRHVLRSPNRPTNFSIDNDVLLGAESYLVSLSKYANVIWFGPRLEPLVTEKEYLTFGCDKSFVPTFQQNYVFEYLDSKLKQFSASKSWHYVSQLDLIKYNFPSDFGDCKRILWIDSNHFSRDGEKVFGSRFTVDELTGLSLKIGTP